MFVDSNIFLEVQLAQKHGEASKKFLKMIQNGRLNAYTTDFKVIFTNYSMIFNHI